MIIAENPFKMGQISAKFSVESGHTPVISSYLRDDIAIADASLELAATQRSTRKMTGGNVVTSSTTYANVSDLAVPINRVGGYAFQYWLQYLTSDVAEGIGVQLAFTGTANGVGYSIETYTAPNTRADLVSPADFGSGVAPYATGPGPAAVGTIVIRGSCNVLTLGTLNLQVRAENGGAASATLLFPSWAQEWSS